MKSITNDFVTIEYRDYQKGIAKYCLEVFNGEPELYKGILNGKTFIRSEELPSIDITDEDKRFNKEVINWAIMRINGIDNKWYPFDDSTNAMIYGFMMDYIYGSPSEAWTKEIGMALAYDYFKKTKDFCYLQKHLYGDGITKDDIMDICTFNIENYYDDLLREKVDKDISALLKDENIIKNFDQIMNILAHVASNANYKFESQNSSKEELYRKADTDPTPKINDLQFEILVREALKYIDPTDELLEEYLKCRRENRIEERNAITGDEISSFHTNGEDYGITLYRSGNLKDVIDLVHEFSHLHYVNKAKNKINTLFDEYPSIYYELKAAEYLSTVGYSEEDIFFITYSRSSSNLTNITYLYPEIQTAYMNYDKLKEEYDLEPIKRMLNAHNEIMSVSYLEKETSFTKEEIEKMIPQLEIEVNNRKWATLREGNFSKVLKYMVGTFLAEDAINNLEHENVLNILDIITQDEYSLYEVLEMQGLISPSGKQQDKPKQKEKIDDQNNQ